MKKILLILLLIVGISSCSDVEIWYEEETPAVITSKTVRRPRLSTKYVYKVVFNGYNRTFIYVFSNENWHVGDTLKLTK